MQMLISFPKNVLRPASAILAPGSYNLPSFTDEWTTEHKAKHGVFTKPHKEGDARSAAGERINCCTLAQCPRSDREPGPGQYSPKVFSINVTARSKINILVGRIFFASYLPR